MVPRSYAQLIITAEKVIVPQPPVGKVEHSEFVEKLLAAIREAAFARAHAEEVGEEASSLHSGALPPPAPPPLLQPPTPVHPAWPCPTKFRIRTTSWKDFFLTSASRQVLSVSVLASLICLQPKVSAHIYMHKCLHEMTTEDIRVM